MTRVLFLDVDGVLNHSGTWSRDVKWEGREQTGTYRLDPECCATYLRLLDAMNLTVVLSSSWRNHDDHVDYLFECKVLPKLHYDWRTPRIEHLLSLEERMGRMVTRGLEIQDWLTRHPEIGRYQYAIVDDDADMLPTQRSRFVQTRHTGPRAGLRDKHVRRIMNMKWDEMPHSPAP